MNKILILSILSILIASCWSEIKDTEKQDLLNIKTEVVNESNNIETWISNEIIEDDFLNWSWPGWFWSSWMSWWF